MEELRPRLVTWTAPHPEWSPSVLDLPVELVRVGHGEPVLSGAREALERALHGPTT